MWGFMKRVFTPFQKIKKNNKHKYRLMTWWTVIWTLSQAHTASLKKLFHSLMSSAAAVAARRAVINFQRGNTLEISVTSLQHNRLQWRRLKTSTLVGLNFMGELTSTPMSQIQHLCIFTPLCKFMVAAVLGQNCFGFN